MARTSIYTIISIALLAVFTITAAVAAPSWASLWPRAENDRSVPNEIIPSSDLRPFDRRIWIVTTACLPWMTGTSINPLLRAAYLAKDRPKGKVTLLVPWLELSDQDIAFPPGIRFNHPNEQLAYVRNWLKERANMPDIVDKLDIRFYSGRYHDEYHSIFPMGDVAELIPDDEADVCVLEEPEHLNWYRAPFVTKAWTEKFKHVVGVVSTNNLLSIALSIYFAKCR